ncbi:MAG TPA: YtxH domain-containing protein [Anaerolineales bacterium]|nr:YtxH domain-containing protein [Anaerolineales bacterium]
MSRHKREHEFEEFEHISGTHATGAGKHVFTGLLIGSVVGAVTMLLFAPRSGEETRAEIRDKAMELRDRTTETVKDTVSQAKTKAYELKENVQHKAAEIKQRGKQTAQEQLDRVSEAAENGKQRVQEY